MSYSIDFRRQVLAIRAKEGLSLQAVSERFSVSKQSVYNWTKRLDPQTSRNKPSTKIDIAALAADVKQYPDSYQFERALRLNVSTRCIGYALKRLGVSYKKNSFASKGMRRKTAYFSG